MVGTKGKSGGSRPRAGRPTGRFTIRQNHKYGISTKTTDGYFLPMQLAEVVEMDRKVLVLRLDNGDQLTIFR